MQFLEGDLYPVRDLEFHLLGAGPGVCCRDRGVLDRKRGILELAEGEEAGEPADE